MENDGPQSIKLVQLEGRIALPKKIFYLIKHFLYGVPNAKTCSCMLSFVVQGSGWRYFPVRCDILQMISLVNAPQRPQRQRGNRIDSSIFLPSMMYDGIDKPDRVLPVRENANVRCKCEDSSQSCIIKGVA